MHSYKQKRAVECGDLNIKMHVVTAVFFGVHRSTSLGTETLHLSRLQEVMELLEILITNS